MYDPKEPADDKGEEAQAEIARQRYEKIMATKDGRWVMWEIIDGCGVRDIINGERAAGAHVVGVTLANTLRSVNLELYHQMIVENDK